MSSSEEESVVGSEEEEVSGEEESVDEVEESEEEEEVQPQPIPAKRSRGKKDKEAKDENKPKRNMSSFFLYSNANRSRIREDNPGTPFGQVAKLLSAEFKTLSSEERAIWDGEAAKDKKRYEDQMADYTPPPGMKKRKKDKDPNKPKRNMSAYFLYSNANRASIKERNPEATFGGIAKLISVEFKALTAKERKKWDDQAVIDKERYVKAMRDYNEPE
jgi:hypothetical protein